MNLRKIVRSALAGPEDEAFRNAFCTAPSVGYPSKAPLTYNREDRLACILLDSLGLSREEVETVAWRYNLDTRCTVITATNKSGNTGVVSVSHDEMLAPVFPGFTPMRGHGANMVEQWNVHRLSYSSRIRSLYASQVEGLNSTILKEDSPHDAGPVSGSGSYSATARFEDLGSLSEQTALKNMEDTVAPSTSYAGIGLALNLSAWASLSTFSTLLVR